MSRLSSTWTRVCSVRPELLEETRGEQFMALTWAMMSRLCLPKQATHMLGHRPRDTWATRAGGRVLP